MPKTASGTTTFSLSISLTNTILPSWAEETVSHTAARGYT